MSTENPVVGRPGHRILFQHPDLRLAAVDHGGATRSNSGCHRRRSASAYSSRACSTAAAPLVACSSSADLWQLPGKAFATPAVVASSSGSSRCKLRRKALATQTVLDCSSGARPWMHGRKVFAAPWLIVAPAAGACSIRRQHNRPTKGAPRAACGSSTGRRRKHRVQPLEHRRHVHFKIRQPRGLAAFAGSTTDGPREHREPPVGAAPAAEGSTDSTHLSTAAMSTAESGSGVAIL
ncbi:hypothetical protein QYE76_027612 [Lolium multiflorum]|uniref:Uncharacterized protein n=1 Tax=Lolium multiflorum TaxID=4521 RepID=A0AAD8QL23_LOLMU|nr:hypothetical protein QYE76_027612 [Lolium multiflorum]